ncbi:MAG: helix-turn-helix domain-containing protein [Candidatus Micrarchaeota archaeon]
MDSDSFGGLIKLGLKEKEARTYLALLRLGEAGASSISKISGIHPRSTYDALESLVSKGLATFAERDGTRVFSPCNLDSLVSWVEERKSVALELLPLLEAQLKKHEAPLVRVFRGKDGMRAVWEDLLKQKQDLYFYGGMMQGFRFHMKHYTQIWNKQREKLQIPVKMLFIDVPGVRTALKGLKFWSSKPLPKKFYSSVPWWLYGNKMVLVFWSEDPLAISIESPELAKTYRHFFNAMWKNKRA